jgi:hypothetical protein
VKAPVRRPANNAAVVIGRLTEAAQSRLAAAGARAAPLPGVADASVVRTKPSDPRALREKIRRAVGDEVLVVPVLIGEGGERFIPTGEIVVRFKHALDARELAQFARRHGLGAGVRNKWSPRQGAFAVRGDDARFLPEIVARIAADEVVDAAWPDTRAHFHRG